MCFSWVFRMDGLWRRFGRRRNWSFLSFFPPFAYAAIRLVTIPHEYFRVDDIWELSFVREQDSLFTLIGRDCFFYFRPIKNLLWLLFSKLDILGVEWCHVVAISIGVLSFFPVLELCRRVLGSEPKAIAASSIWLLSPTLVSSTAWLSCLNIQVMVAFSALTIIFHDKAWDSGVFRVSAVVSAGLFLFVSLVSYESAIAVFPILILFDAMLRPRRVTTKLAGKSYCFYAAIVVLYLACRSFAGSRTGVQDSWTQATWCQLVVTSPYFTLQHFTSWFWPFGRFTVLGSYKWGDVPLWILISSAVFGFLVIALSWLIRNKSPVFSFCLFFSLLGFAPASNCLGFGNGPYGDYYLTLPSIGLAAGCVELLAMLSNQPGLCRRVARVLGAVFVVVRLATIEETISWARLWANTDSACETSIRNFPIFVSNKIALIREICSQGRYHEALQLGREIEDWLAPESPKMGYVHLVRAIVALNERKDAKETLDQLLLCESCHLPDVPQALLEYYRGCVFEDLQHQVEAAKERYERALGGEWNKDLVPCADRLARILAIEGNLPDAVSFWEKAVKLDPDNVSVLWNLSIAYRDSGQPGKSAELLEKVRMLTGNPDSGRQ